MEISEGEEEKIPMTKISASNETNLAGQRKIYKTEQIKPEEAEK